MSSLVRPRLLLAYSNLIFVRFKFRSPEKQFAKLPKVPTYLCWTGANKVPTLISLECCTTSRLCPRIRIGMIDLGVRFRYIRLQLY